MSYIKGEEIEVALPYFRPNLSILELLVEKLKTHGDGTAMIEANTGLRVSYAELLRHSMSLAAGLQKTGVSEGDLVVLCCETSVLAISLMFGAMFTGAAAVIIAPEDAESAGQMLGDKFVKAVFYDAEREDPMKKCVATMNPSPLVVSIIEWNNPEITGLNLSDHNGFLIFNVQDPRLHVPLVLPSSGTTGLPKLIPITDYALQYIGCINVLEDVQCHLLASSFAWVTTYVVLMKAVLNKFTLIILNSNVPKVLLGHIYKYQVDSLFMGPTLLVECARESFNQPSVLGTVRIINTGGDKVSTSQAISIMKSPLYQSQPNLYVFYGSTEVNMMCYFNLKELSTQYKTGYCGRPFPGIVVKIVDEDNRTLPLGELGSVAAKGPAQSPGYLDRPELNQQVFREDGFIMTGDIGYIDVGGELYILGRACDVINYRGFKVAPLEIEDVLMSHPEVKDAIVVAKEHPTDIHHAKGFVVTVPGSAVSSQALEDYVNDRVKEPMKIRAGVHFLNQIPRRGPKPKRNLLKQL